MFKLSASMYNSLASLNTSLEGKFCFSKNQPVYIITLVALGLEHKILKASQVLRLLWDSDFGLGRVKTECNKNFQVIIQHFYIVIHVLALLGSKVQLQFYNQSESYTFYICLIQPKQGSGTGADFSTQQQWIVFAQFGINNTENMCCLLPFVERPGFFLHFTFSI